MTEKDEPILHIQSTDSTFSTYITSPYVKPTSYDRLQKANLLMVPNHGYGENEDLVYFPSGSAELFRYLNEHRSEEVILDATIEEEHYKELSLHADWIYLATFVVSSVVAPILINLIASYIYDVLTNRAKNGKVRSSIVVIDENREKQIQITYDGPAETYRDIMFQALREHQDTSSADTSNKA